MRSEAKLVFAFCVACVCGCRSPETAPGPNDSTEKDYSELEVELGRRAEGIFLQAFRVDDDPAVVNQLRRVGRRLAAVAERSQIKYTFLVLDTKQKNAMSFPNGRVMVTGGLFSLLADDDELAVIVGHELAHINHKDALRSLEREDKLLWQRIFVGGTIGLIPVAGAKLSFLVLNRAHSHQQELDADLTGAEYMHRAGFDLAACVRVLEKFQRDSELRESGGFFTTHPGTEKRLQVMRDQVEKLTAGAPARHAEE